MRTSASSRLILAAALAAAAILPALGQDRPESILPPGFDRPATPAPAPTRRPAASPTPRVAVTPRPAASAAPAPRPTDAASPAAPTATPSPNASPTPRSTAAPGMVPPAGLTIRYELPDYARRQTAIIGVQPIDLEAPTGPEPFGGADGRYVEELMRRIDAPIASRWLSITLRRFLTSPLAAPGGVNGADFAAERAWLLVRMGEAADARALVQLVDPDQYTPKLFQVAMQAALAAGDPGALCPLVDHATMFADDRAWILARAMCGGLGAQPQIGQPALKRAQTLAYGNAIDLLLAQKIAGSGIRDRQAVTITWDDVPRLTIWRYGLATASGEAIPDQLFDTVGPQVRYWQALSPMLTPGKRIADAELATAQGVLSGAALVDLYAQASADESDNESGADVIASDLATAYADAARSSRLQAFHRLWDEPKDPVGRYARLVLTGRAAVRFPVGASGADADQLIAAMISVGLDRTAQKWRGKVEAGGMGWALLTLADPDNDVAVGSGDLATFSSRAGDALRTRMLVAGLAGLGRLGDVNGAAGSYGVAVGAENGWTRAIDAAARANRPGEVLLLAALGMQTYDWSGVPPEAVFHAVRALKAVGLDPAARMIAAEAVTRT